MSQLFEALKKIQKKEGEGREPLPPMPSPQKPRGKKSRRPWILLAVALSVLLLAGGGLLYYTQRLTRTSLSSPPRMAEAPRPLPPQEVHPQSSTKATAPLEETSSRSASPSPKSSTAESPPAVSPKAPSPPTKTQPPSPKPPAPAPKETAEAQVSPPTTRRPVKKATRPSPHAEAYKAPSENYKKTYLLMSANENLEKGNILQALELYQRYVTIDDTNAQVWNNIGAIYLRMGQPRRALAVLERASHLDPQDPGIQVNLAIALWEMGQKEAASKKVEELKLRDDLNPQAVYNLVVLMIRMGERREAYRVLQRAERRMGAKPLLITLHPYFRDLEEQNLQAGTPTAPR